MTDKNLQELFINYINSSNLKDNLGNLLLEENKLRLLNNFDKLLSDIIIDNSSFKINEVKRDTLKLKLLRIKNNPNKNHKIFEILNLEDYLQLYGQRLTHASIVDDRAIPRSKEYLLDRFNMIHAERLTVGARALSKHINRDSFWGELSGNANEKNNAAEKLILNILEKFSWYNVFGHFKYEYIIEYRLATGHGARWNENKFIGFVEPVDQNLISS